MKEEASIPMGKDIWNYVEITLHVLGETGLTAIKED